MQRPKSISTFRFGSEKWIFVVFGAINPLSRQKNAPKKKFSTGIHPSLFNAPKTPRSWTGLEKTIGTIGTIEKAIIIVAFVAQDF